MNVFAQQDMPRFTNWQEKPKPGEPGHGYFARLVRGEAHVSARVYASVIEINGRNIVLQEILDELLKIPLDDIHRESLRRWTPVWDGRRHIMSGETLRRRQLSIYNRRFCRGCLAEGAYHRAWWDIVPFHTCPFHSIPLESQTKRKEAIGWWWPSFEIAPDGEHLPVRHPRNEDADSFEHYVLQRLGFVSGPARPLLDAAPFHEVIDVCEVVGRLVSNPWSERSPRKKAVECRAGFEFLSGTREQLEAGLERWLVTTVPEEIRNSGLVAGYGWMGRNTPTNHSRSVAWPEIWLGMRRAFARTGRIGRQHQDGGDLPHRDVTIKEAALEIGVDVRGLRKVSQQIGLTPSNPGPSDRAYLSRGQADELQAVALDLLPVKKAASMLGCSQDTVRGLIDIGLLAGFSGTRLFGHDGHGLALRRSQIEAFLWRAASVPLSGARGLTHNLAYLARMVRRKSAEIARDVLDGTIKVSHLDRRGIGLGMWRFDAVSHKLPYRRQAHDEDIRAVEAAAISGFTIEAMAAIVDAGVVAARNRGGRLFLMRESFESFHARFTNAKLYLAETGCTDVGLAAWLLDHGVERHFPGVRAKRATYIVERKAIESALHSPRTSDPKVWTTLREELAKVCPSFVVPPSSGGRTIKAYLSTRATFVELLVDGGAVVIRKTFREAAPREWAVFVANQQRIRDEWSMFTWSKKTARGDVTAELRFATKAEAIAAAAALARLYGHFKNPRALNR